MPSCSVWFGCYQLSYTFIANSQEDEARQFAQMQVSADLPNVVELRAKAEADYLDSIGNIPLYGFTL